MPLCEVRLPIKMRGIKRLERGGLHRCSSSFLYPGLDYDDHVWEKLYAKFQKKNNKGTFIITCIYKTVHYLLGWDPPSPWTAPASAWYSSLYFQLFQQMAASKTRNERPSCFGRGYAIRLHLERLHDISATYRMPGQPLTGCRSFYGEHR